MQCILYALPYGPGIGLRALLLANFGDFVVASHLNIPDSEPPCLKYIIIREICVR